MTLKIAHTNDAPRPTEDVTSPPQSPGWDPFEVWRTRVLLPRIAEATEAARKSAPPPHVQLVTRKR